MILALAFLFSLPALGSEATGEAIRRPEAGHEPTLVFLVRHAEKGGGDVKDPELSEAGSRRAATLARMLEHARVTHLFATEYRRTRETLRPLAERIGMEVTVVPGRAQEEQVTRLRELPPGSVAVVAGHSNTVPDMVRALGGEVSDLTTTELGEMLADDEYDRLFLVILRSPAPGAASSSPTTLDLRYGD
jgi:phosphohistidine phosphatase SixA